MPEYSLLKQSEVQGFGKIGEKKNYYFSDYWSGVVAFGVQKRYTRWEKGVWFGK